MTTQRAKRMRFNRSHPVKTFRVTSGMAEFLNQKNIAERIGYISKALHHFLNGGKPTYSHRESK